jgi:methyl-accepting chemotaxis protein
VEGWKSVRGKVSIIVAVCLLPALAVSVVALTSLASVNAKVTSLDRHSVRPLGALGDLRDMEGDTRVLVWQYLAATAAERVALKAEVAEVDDQADTDIAAYFRDHGSRTDKRGLLMTEFVTLLGQYRSIRDTQAFTAADGKRVDSAYRAVEGPLNAANEAMAVPLDTVFGLDVAAAAADKKRADRSYALARIAVGTILLLGLLLAAGAAWQLTRGMLFAIARIRSVMISGDRTDRVGETGDRGDLAQLAAAIDAMLDSVAAQDAALAGDQDERQAHLRTAYVRQQLAEQELRRRAQTVIDDTAATVLAELHDVVAQAEMVLSAGATIDDRLSVADEVTRNVVSQAREADRVVAAVGESLRRVGGIAKLIATVAEQTNLLALNATIEAARAGEAGRGFSVVAAEVKDLAAQTARSTSEITTTVGDLENAASAMASAITGMADGVKGIDDATARVSEVAGEQRATVEHLDLSVRTALARIRSMAQLTEGLERRHSERVNVTGTIQVRSRGRTFTSNLRDISETGLRCSQDPGSPLTVGSAVEAELRFADRAEWLGATVIRGVSTPDGDDLGLKLILGSPAELAFVREYVDAITGVDVAGGVAVPA